MLVCGGQHVIVPWLHERRVCAEHPESTQTFAWLTPEGHIQGALAFHHFNGRSVWCDIALEGGRFPKPLLHAGLWYPFAQLGVRRLTFAVAPSNLKSIALVEGLGAYRGATLEDGCQEGEVYIYYLLPDKCPIWRRFSGKVRQFSAAGSGPGEASSSPRAGESQISPDVSRQLEDIDGQPLWLH